MQKLLIATLGLTSFLSAASNCESTPPTTCYADDCERCYCLGPENILVNAPVGPTTCNGDFTITIAGLYWNAHQDGMEYAITNSVLVPTVNPTTAEIQRINNLTLAEYETPHSSWEYGFKLGIGYQTTCDGWDLGLNWISFSPKASSHIEADVDDNSILIALWSAFAPAQGETIFARDIKTDWEVDLDLVDFELGRAFWVSHYLALRPFLGFRYGSINQKYDLEHIGGSWSPRTSPIQNPFTNEVNLRNKYRGFGLRSGLNSLWHVGCGFSLYGDLAASILYGRFSLSNDERNRLANNDNAKTKILQTSESFRASRALVDLALGVQWAGMFCDCSYGIAIKLGYEQHLFFHQNQLWRVNRSGDTSQALPNNTGENVYQQRRGTLDTQGITLTVMFTF